jgi:hypothetical protein
LDWLIVAEDPGSMFPVSKLLLSSAVVVWAVASRLVTVIVSWVTVREAGTNLKLSIVTAAGPALGGDCDEPLDVGCCDALGFAAPCAPCELSELPQPVIDAATAAAATSKVVRCRSCTACSIRLRRRTTNSLDRTGADMPGKMETLIADRQMRTPGARPRRR